MRQAGQLFYLAAVYFMQNSAHNAFERKWRCVWLFAFFSLSLSSFAHSAPNWYSCKFRILRFSLFITFSILHNFSFWPIQRLHPAGVSHRALSTSNSVPHAMTSSPSFGDENLWITTFSKKKKYTFFSNRKLRSFGSTMQKLWKRIGVMARNVNTYSVFIQTSSLLMKAVNGIFCLLSTVDWNFWHFTSIVFVVDYRHILYNREFESFALWR